MTDDRVMARARGLWEQLAAVPLSFPSSGGIAIAASPGSRLCPPSWAGIVQLGDAAIVTAPGEAQAGLLRQALEQVPVASLVCSSACARLWSRCRWLLLCAPASFARGWL